MKISKRRKNYFPFLIHAKVKIESTTYYFKQRSHIIFSLGL
jgi:hypothetical protein